MKTSLELVNLYPQQIYEVWVQAATIKGEGPSTRKILIKPSNSGEYSPMYMIITHIILSLCLEHFYTVEKAVEEYS